MWGCSSEDYNEMRRREDENEPKKVFVPDKRSKRVKLIKECKRRMNYRIDKMNENKSTKSYHRREMKKEYTSFKEKIIDEDPFYTYAKYNRRKLPRELLDLILN